MTILPIKRLVYEISSNRSLPLHDKLPTVTFRGAFGYSLFQILSRDFTIPSMQKKAEVYQNLFYPEGIDNNSMNKNPGRPFVLRGDYTRLDRKSFIMEMMLFGRCIDAEILLDTVINNMCEMGVGNQNMRCRCVKLYSEILELAKPVLDNGNVCVNMQTPTRIKSNKVYLTDSLPFYNLIARLQARIKDLVSTYTSNEPPECDFELLELAKKIVSIPAGLEYFRTKRTSSRTDMDCNLSGLTGSMHYSGNLKPFEEILSYLPWVHIGSSTAFGCGWCTIKYSTSY